MSDVRDVYRYNYVFHTIIERRYDGRVCFKKDLSFGSIVVREMSLYFRPGQLFILFCSGAMVFNGLRLGVQEFSGAHFKYRGE